MVGNNPVTSISKVHVISLFFICTETDSVLYARLFFSIRSYYFIECIDCTSKVFKQFLKLLYGKRRLQYFGA